MYSTSLEVVNGCIATLGEAPLNSLSDDHTFKASALNYLDASLKTVLKRALWFNTEVIDLQPDLTASYIYIPNDALHVERISELCPPFAQRGRRLYDPVLNRYEWDNPVTVKLVRLLPFEDCPFFAQDVIALSAILRFQREFDGDTTRYGEIQQDLQRAEVELQGQHIREVRANLLNRIDEQMAVRGITRYPISRAIPVNYTIKRTP